MKEKEGKEGDEEEKGDGKTMKDDLGLNDDWMGDDGKAIGKIRMGNNR